MVSDNIRVKQWAKLKYHDPAWILGYLRWIQLNLERGVSEDVANLRPRGLRNHLEGRQAALFAYGMTELLGEKFLFAMHEDSDYDAVFFNPLPSSAGGNIARFTPVQLKELVPEKLNRQTSIEGLLRDLTKYATSSDLQVGIHVNRNLPGIDFRTIQVPDLPVGGVWLFGGVSSDQAKWFIYGSLMMPPDERASVYFEHPLLSDEQVLGGA